MSPSPPRCSRVDRALYDTPPQEETQVLRGTLIQRFGGVRNLTEELCAPLEIEDFVLQSMPDASPASWHLAHTTWFFETFLLRPHVPAYQPVHKAYHHLFNSYYQGVGSPYERSRRGLLSRPTVRDVRTYRRSVDESVHALLEAASPEQLAVLEPIVILGLHHEQQHQELLLTDLKHAFSFNPIQPSYTGRTAVTDPAPGEGRASELPRVSLAGGVVRAGHQGAGFCFDNELPNHETFIHDFRISASPVSNGSFCEFIREGGYSRAGLWLSDGWDAVQAGSWDAPLYWTREDGDTFSVFTLTGPEELDPEAAVTHLSYYEADAFARWAGARLPTEFEWEHFAGQVNSQAAEGTSLEDRTFHPRKRPGAGPHHLFGEVWEWTASAYSSYPGFRPLAGALGEYNGKFMSGAMVLRGGSCVSPKEHVRATYRNFFAPDKRWQFSGLRLAEDG